MSAPVPHASFDAAATATHDAPLDATLTPSRRGDGWTAAAQRKFLELIAEGLKVETAARLVGLTPTSAYQLRRRASGAAFALGWRAASLVARDKIADELMARAVDGQVETITRADGSEVIRHRYDNRFAMSLLARLDRQVESAADADTKAARLVAQEFDAFLGGLTDEGNAARAGLFLARRGMGADDARDLAPVLALASAERLARTGVATAEEVVVADLDLAQRSAWSAEQWQRAEAAGLLALATPKPAPADGEAPHISASCEECEDSPTRQQLVQLLSGGDVWFDEHDEKWRTTFAPPPDFYGSEKGAFGDPYYQRTLSPEEEEVVFARLAAIRAAASADDMKFRDAWFGFRPEGEGDAEGCDTAEEAGDDLVNQAAGGRSPDDKAGDIPADEMPNMAGLSEETGEEEAGDEKWDDSHYDLPPGQWPVNHHAASRLLSRGEDSGTCPVRPCWSFGGFLENGRAEQPSRFRADDRHAGHRPGRRRRVVHPPPAQARQPPQMDGEPERNVDQMRRDGPQDRPPL